MCTNPSPLILGTTGTSSLVRLPDVLRIVSDDPHSLVRELHRQAREEGYRGDLTAIDGETPTDAAPRIAAALHDDDQPRRMVVLDLRDPLHPPVGPAAAAIGRAAYTRGHPVLVLVPRTSPTLGIAAGLYPPETPAFALAPADQRGEVIGALVARDRQDEAREVWTGGPAEGLLVTADGALTQPVTTTIPATAAHEETA